MEQGFLISVLFLVVFGGFNNNGYHLFVQAADPTASTSTLIEEVRRVTHVLKPGKEAHIEDKFDFQQFCRVGEKKYVAYYFRTATLRIISSAEDIKLIKGSSPMEVYLQYQQSGKWLLWLANSLPWRARDTHFPTFNTSCVGIVTSRPYTAVLIVKPVDFWKVLTLLTGLALFFMAPQLSKSTMFFYTSGTLVGALAAALVFLFIVYRFLPKSKSGHFFFLTLSSMALYLAGESWRRVEELFHEKLPYIVAYVFVGSVISFLACYRWGPPVHPRTLDIIRWALQLFGLILIHFSSDLVEMSTTIIILVLTWFNVKGVFKYYARKYYNRLFPPPRMLLTEEEYINQGAVETKKALDDLRTFCHSPEAKPWVLVNRLKNPRRFSNFIQGSSHLEDDEILNYEDDSYRDEIPAITSPPPRNRRSSRSPNNFAASPNPNPSMVRNVLDPVLTDDSDEEIDIPPRNVQNHVPEISEDED